MSRKHVMTGVGVLILALAAGWAMGFIGTDAEVAELERLRDERFQNRDAMTDEQRRAQFEGFRERIRGLSDEQRRQFFESSRPMFQRMINERMDEFLAMSPDEQRAEIDKRIDQMEERRKEREASGDNQGGNRRNDMSPEQRDQRRKERLDHTTPELRDKMDQIKDLFNKRREERGLDPIDRPGGGFGRPGRGGPR